MKTLITMIFVLGLWCLNAQGQGIEALVVEVKDGDSLVVLHEDKTTEQIRLAFVDTPERGQPFWKVAKSALSGMVFGRRVMVVQLDKDRYGRTVAEVDVDGVNVGTELIRLGLAWVFTRYCEVPYCEELKALEAEARWQGRGLWVDREPIPPWEFRKKRIIGNTHDGS